MFSIKPIVKKKKKKLSLITTTSTNSHVLSSLIYHPCLQLWLLLIISEGAYAFPLAIIVRCCSVGRVSDANNRPTMQMRRSNNHKITKIETDWDDIFQEDNNGGSNSSSISSRIKDKDDDDVVARRRGNNQVINNREDITASINNQDEKSNETLKKTLPGGQSLLFEMARKLFVWDDHNTDEYDGNSLTTTKSPLPQLPRWRPYEGVSNDNSHFRSSPPRMTSEGYARSIQRHSRKRNQPSMWMYALRMYNKTCNLEQKITKGFLRTAAHYEGALVACSKLGFWEESFRIFNDAKQNKSVRITEGMALSVIRACIRASYTKREELPNNTNEATTSSSSFRRKPLDAAKDFVLKLEDEYGIFMAPRYVNPLAAAYQTIGCYKEGDEVIHTLLPTTERSDDEDEDCVMNVCATKDNVSYSLLVKSRVANGEWSKAVQVLKRMTEAGMYPIHRDLNSWKEISSSKNRFSSWKKRKNVVWIMHRGAKQQQQQQQREEKAE